ncbi:MAG: MBL fold metallo-hydrolase [Pseudomonadota bacterium]
MHIEFFGAAGEVTGSCHILHVAGRKILLDCGMIQGSRRDERRNADPFPFEAGDVDAVVLSHAHLDHSGRLPLLVRRGFRNSIFVQNASLDLANVLLRDAASLAERDAESENRRRQRAGRDPVKPLFVESDAKQVIKQMVGLKYAQPQEVIPGVTVTFHDAGHILGSAIVELVATERDLTRRIVFSGDLGQYDTPVLRDPVSLPEADLVLMESTYGASHHRERAVTFDEIGAIVRDSDKGNIIIPAFAVGRSQELLYLFGKHYREWDMQRFRIFLDSPMAIKASHIYWDYPHLYDDEATKLRREHDEMPPLPNLHLTASAQESRLINRKRSGAIIIAGSGMCTGGRVLHHLKHNLWRKETQVMIVGYQAKGSLGQRLVDKAPYVRIHGQTVRNRARTHTVGGLSAHGDQADLTRWYRGFRNRPPVCLVHGEREKQYALAEALRSNGADVSLPEPGSTHTLS